MVSIINILSKTALLLCRVDKLLSEFNALFSVLQVFFPDVERAEWLNKVISGIKTVYYNTCISLICISHCYGPEM